LYVNFVICVVIIYF